VACIPVHPDFQESREQLLAKYQQLTEPQAAAES